MGVKRSSLFRNIIPEDAFVLFYLHAIVRNYTEESDQIIHSAEYNPICGPQRILVKAPESIIKNQH